MASWTTPATLPVDSVLSSPDWNDLAADVTFLYQKPYIMAYNDTTTPCDNGVNTQVTLGGLTASGYGFSVVANNVIVPLTGVYQVSFAVQTTAGSGSTGDYVSSLVAYGGVPTIQGAQVQSSTNAPLCPGAGQILCSAGGGLGLFLTNFSGSTLNTNASSFTTFLHVSFIGSQ